MSLSVRAAAAATALCLAGAGTADPWDITATGQPHRDVRFSVDEGTWMNVSVSPDGNLLAFDLLGDIYTLPAAGGRATLIHGGPAIQRSPRFSPDGERLIYLSDASGGDDVWTSRIDGTAPRRITSLAPDLVGAPAWSPDGAYFAAARMTSTFPKLRGSELRLYSLAGGAGRPLVPMPANGRDVQEAEFGPDGRYLYYTEKVSDPGIFVDANHINHVVRRRDLATGATTTLVGGFGGATSPQVSPDGSLLAFVRRVKDHTVLFVYDLDSREQRPVFDGLERDLQADFVPYSNYYPAYDWFPDGRHVAIWAGGKLQRVNVETREVTPIPFQAEVRQRITDAVRTAPSLAPERVRVRALRHPAVAPDAGAVTFHALGRLWQQQLPDGEPRRLTDAAAFEFEPAYSADGRQLAFVTWDDETGGALVVSDARGRQPRVVAKSPGVIREPAFSPDGEQLAFRLEAGNKIMGGYETRGGLYRVALDGGPPRYVRESGERPRFSADGERLYYIHTEAEGGIYSSSVSVTRLESVTLDGHDEREHAFGPDVRDVVASPQLDWIAFKQHQQYHLVPYRETGTPLELSSTGSTVPVTTLTSLGGYGITWAAGRAWWLLGPSLHDVAPEAALAAAPPTPRVVDIELTAESDEPSGTVAFVHGRVITMEDDRVIDDGTVIVTGNRITAVGPAADIPLPDDAHVVDARGKTIMPGMVDMHGHIDCCYPDDLIPQKQPARYAALAFGVTTNFDPYTSELPHYSAAEMTLTGDTLGPRFIGSGSVIYGRTAKPDFTYDPIGGLEDAERIMQRKAALGGTIIKSYKQPLRRQRQQLVKAGRDAGIMVDGEGGNDFYVGLSMILDGHTILEHNLPPAVLYDDVVQLMTHGDTANTPTLIVTFGEIMGENYLYQTGRAWEHPKARTFVQAVNSSYSPLDVPYGAPPHVRGMTTLHAADEVYDVGFRTVARSVRELDAAGVTINAGSHGQFPGLAMHWELWLLAEGGMPPHRVLRTATINGARSLGVDDQIGSLAPGKLADLIVLDRDPLADIRNTDSVRYTMINGRLYDAATMNEIGNHPRERGRFYWELGDYGDIDWNESWSGQ